jgi:hypothetical protein
MSLVQLGPKGEALEAILKVTDPTVRQLFFCSTKITIGNGKTTPF